MIIEIYPEKAQFLSKEEIKLIVECEQPTADYYEARLTITHLQNKIHNESYHLYDSRNEITMPGMDTDFGGYGVEIMVYYKSELLGRSYTAFDVVSECSRSIRYGFLSDFDSVDGTECEDVSNLRKFHINMIQYYDWSYRHDDFVGKEMIYKDMMGRQVDRNTVKIKIAACKKYGIKSLGYGAVYAASKGFYEEHKESGLYTSSGEPLVFIDTFYIMNVSNKSNWREHIIGEYAKAVSEVGFDGIHMDTYGFPKTAYSYHQQELIQLAEEYPSLIEDTKKRLDEVTPENHLIFNNVGNWPVSTVVNTPQDAVYIEVWEPYVKYSHIKQIIREAARERLGNKPIILAAYLAPFREDTPEKAVIAALLLTAAVTVNGAYNLLLGENNAVLTQGYYVDHSFLQEAASEKLRSYYDFLVQYMELFYDDKLKDVSMTHIGWDNTEYRCLTEPWSVDGEAEKIWITVREKESRKLISFINLCGNPDNNWNAGKEQPIIREDIKMEVQIDKEVKGVYFLSPDMDHGKLQEICYEKINSDRGWKIQFMVPKLEIWSNIWVDLEE
jgi:dextranase